MENTRIDMSDKVSLKEVIFQEFLKDPSLGPSEMAKKLGAKYNSVKAVFAKLTKEGLLERPRRGEYIPNINGILLQIIERIEDIENSLK
jgi:Mn-dependent DtxR family transcriptional regulator